MTIEELIVLTLQEDIGDGDHTSNATIPITLVGKAKLLVKEDGVIAGIGIARQIMNAVDPTIVLTALIEDGMEVKKGDIVFEVVGPFRSILTAERTVLNFMQRMSGIATQTRRMVEQIIDLPCKLLDTRKTTPLFREIEKMAVKIGGGTNHRFGLFDMILIKDNHVDACGGIELAIRSVHEYMRSKEIKLPIEIETRNLEEVGIVLSIGGVDRIMLDNFSTEELKEAVRFIDRRIETEASGGITLKNLREIAETGVDYISVGSLTHQIRSLDLSLKAVLADSKAHGKTGS